MSNNAQNLTRKQLAEFLPDPRAVRMFENLLKQVNTLIPADIESLYKLVQEAYVDAMSADAKATQALDALNRIADALELIAHGPAFNQTTQGGDEPQLPLAPYLAEDNLLPPTPLGTLGMQQSDAVSISGGNIDGTPIGQSSASTGSFTTVQTSGNAGIGSGPVATQTLRVGANLTGGTIAYGIVSRGQVQSDVTVGSYSYTSFAQFANFAAGAHKHYSAGQGTIGGTLSVQMGFEADSSLVGAATNYGFYSNLGAAAANWNFYANGSARNYFNGNTQIGSATPTAGDEKLQVNGALSINSATMLRTYTAFTNGAGAGVGTLTNAPAAGNPTKWIPINDNGTTRYVPAW